MGDTTRYNFSAGNFHTKKLSRLYSSEVYFY